MGSRPDPGTLAFARERRGAPNGPSPVRSVWRMALLEAQKRLELLRGQNECGKILHALTKRQEACRPVTN
jgi:hypothetical protein